MQKQFERAFEKLLKVQKEQAGWGLKNFEKYFETFATLNTV